MLVASVATSSLTSALAVGSRSELQHLLQLHLAELSSDKSQGDVDRLVQTVLCLADHLGTDLSEIVRALVDPGRIPIITSALGALQRPDFVLSLITYVVLHQKQDLFQCLAARFRPLVVDALLQLPGDMLGRACGYCQSLLSERVAELVPLSPEIVVYAMTESSSIFEVILGRLSRSLHVDLSAFRRQVLAKLVELDRSSDQYNGDVVMAFPILAKFAGDVDAEIARFALQLLADIGQTTGRRALEAVLCLIGSGRFHSRLDVVVDMFLAGARRGKIRLRDLVSSRMFSFLTPIPDIIVTCDLIARFLPCSAAESDGLWAPLERACHHHNDEVVSKVLHLLSRLSAPTTPWMNWPLALSLLDIRHDWLHSSQTNGARRRHVAVVESILLELCSAPDALMCCINAVFHRIAEFGPDPNYIGCYDVALLQKMVLSKGDRSGNLQLLLKLVKDRFQISAAMMLLDLNSALKYSFTSSEVETIASFENNPWLWELCHLFDDIGPIHDLVRAVLVAQIRNWSRPSAMALNIVRSQRILRLLWRLNQQSPLILQRIDCSGIVAFIRPVEVSALLTAILDRMITDSQYDESSTIDLLQRILFNNIEHGPVATLLHKVIADRDVLKR